MLFQIGREQVIPSFGSLYHFASSLDIEECMAAFNEKCNFFQKILCRSDSTAFNYSPQCSVCILVICACTLWSCLPSWPLPPVDSFASLLSSHRDTIKLLSISHLFCRGTFKILSLLYLLLYEGVFQCFPISSHLFRVTTRLCCLFLDK